MTDKPDLENNAKTKTESKTKTELVSAARQHMHKRVERKEDGRHLLYYSFSDKMPLPDNSQKLEKGL